MRYIYIIAFLIGGVFLQHMIHELMHVFVARSQGLKVEKVQWFTYHGGTKVFIENEEKVLNGEMPITKQWISSYMLLCAFQSVGDLCLVNRVLSQKKYITKIIAVLVFILNCALTYFLIKYQ